MNRRLGWILMLTAGVVANSGCHMAGQHRCCGTCQQGCRPVPVGWQRGGTDYQTHLNHQAYRNQPSGSGAPTAAVAYPYYTNRGPRDFLVNNPATIGR